MLAAKVTIGVGYSQDPNHYTCIDITPAREPQGAGASCCWRPPKYDHRNTNDHKIPSQGPPRRGGAAGLHFAPVLGAELSSMTVLINTAAARPLRWLSLVAAGGSAGDIFKSLAQLRVSYHNRRFFCP